VETDFEIYFCVIFAKSSVLIFIHYQLRRISREVLYWM